MASRALTARLTMTCSNCETSTFTGQRSRPCTRSSLTFSPIRRRSSMVRSESASPRSSTCGRSVCRREKASNWRTSVAARVAFCLICMMSWNDGSVGLCAFSRKSFAIMMANDFLLNAHKPTDPSFQDIMQIKQNATRAATLVRQLLAFSRRQTLRPQVLDLGDALSDLRILLQRLIGEKVRLDLVHGRDLWPVKVDVSQIEQVIVNLAVNARDAMPSGGKLAIKTGNVTAEQSAQLAYKGMPVAEYVRIDLSDTGSGIPLDIRDKIFEPFFTTKDVGKGTGLGLSTVYGIVKQTGGFIYVDSEEGKG